MSNTIHNDTTSAATQNTQTNAKKSTENSKTAEVFSKMVDQFRVLGVVNIDGGDGDDIINASGEQVNINGGAGNDVINAYGGQVNLHGGIGNDVLSGHAGQANLYGGAGNDTLNANANQANVNGGAGNDVINAHADQVNVHGDEGNDEINAFGVQMNIEGGQGDDVIQALGMQANIYGGTGNDTLDLVGAQIANIKYLKGDGHDTIRSAKFSSSVNIGPGLTLDQATFSAKGADITLHFSESNGSITIKDYKEFGVPRIQFSDGQSLSAAEFVRLAGGDPEAFKMGASHLTNVDKEIVDLA